MNRRDVIRAGLGLAIAQAGLGQARAGAGADEELRPLFNGKDLEWLGADQRRARDVHGA